jgi:hypothetical protein
MRINPMIWRQLKLVPAAICLALVVMTALPAAASKLTSVIDSFERKLDSNLDFAITAGWDFSSQSGVIRREFRCISHDLGSGPFCPGQSQIIDVDELKVARDIHRFNVDLTLGFWRFAQLSINLPIVLADQTNLQFADGVDQFNSSVDPQDSPSLFSLGGNDGQGFLGSERAGVADPTIGVRFTPYSWARDPTRPTWAIGLDLTMPVVSVKKADNDAVGEGVWKVVLSTAISSRAFSWFEPYFRVDGTFQMEAKDSLYQQYGKTQTLLSPGHQLGIALGTEFIVHEESKKEQSFIIDVGGSVRFQFEGRTYTDLFEALGTSSCDPRDTLDPCDLTTYSRGDIDPVTENTRKTDGLTDIEQYATVSGWLGFRWQIQKHVGLRAMFQIAHDTDHFLTTADAGKDLDGLNQVEKENSMGDNEYNPVYSDAYDSLGRRFLSGNIMRLGAQVSLMGKF